MNVCIGKLEQEAGEGERSTPAPSSSYAFRLNMLLKLPRLLEMKGNSSSSLATAPSLAIS